MSWISYTRPAEFRSNLIARGGRAIHGFEERLREELSGIESKSMMTCHARLQLTQDTGSRTHCPLNKTYRITLFKAPPPPGLRTKTSSSKCTMQSLKRRSRSVHRKQKQRSAYSPSPSSSFLLSTFSQIPPSFSAPASPQDGSPFLLSVNGRQDVLSTSARKHHNRSHVDVYQQRRL